jgi:hypothetical protein
MTIQTPHGEFTEPLDWREYLSDVFADRQFLPTFQLNLKYDYAGREALLELLGDELRGSGADIRMADAALGLIETGTDVEARAARDCNYSLAPRARDRMLRLLFTDRQRLHRCNVLYGLLLWTLELSPIDRDVNEALIAAATEFHDCSIFPLAARHVPEWFIRHIPELCSSYCLAMLWIEATPESHRARLVEALASHGAAYVDNVVKLLVAPRLGQAGPRFEAMVAGNPVFAAALAKARAAAPPPAPDQHPASPLAVEIIDVSDGRSK